MQGVIRGLVGLIGACALACGGDAAHKRPDAGSHDAAPLVDAAPPIDPDAILRACAIISSCTGYDLSACVGLAAATLDAAQIACITTATVAACDAATACMGLRRSPDAACVESCLDADTTVDCIDGVRHEIDCPAYLENVGPNCVATAARIDCGGVACAVEGERSCTGTTYSVCDAGITEVYDCARRGLECVPRSPGCVGIASGTCTPGTPATCDGDVLVECDGDVSRRRDCSRSAGMTCVDRDGEKVCAYATTCHASADPDTCNGTVLEACVSGAFKTIDCTAIGGTSCAASGPDVDAHCIP